jgi:hypothetical protein
VVPTVSTEHSAVTSPKWAGNSDPNSGIWGAIGLIRFSAKMGPGGWCPGVR